MTYRTLPDDQKPVFLAALKGIIANPRLMGSTRKVAACKAVRLAAQVARDATR